MKQGACPFTQENQADPKNSESGVGHGEVPTQDSHNHGPTKGCVHICSKPSVGPPWGNPAVTPLRPKGHPGRQTRDRPPVPVCLPSALRLP